jgi:5-methylthioadenosine/S-adenosylhomocysteine deaminase
LSEYYTAAKAYIDGQVVTDAWIEVDHDSITATGTGSPPGDGVTDFGLDAIFPTFVNTHTHTYLTLLRGTLDNLEVDPWLRGVYDAVQDYGVDHAYLGAALSFAEMLCSGTTTVADFFYLNGRGTENIRAAIRAAQDLGIRLIMGRTFLDAEWGGEATRETVEIAEEGFREVRAAFEGYPNIEISPAPHSIMGASRPMLEAAHRLAVEYDTLWYTHLSYSPSDVDRVMTTFGARSVELLEGWGVLSDRLVGAHALYLDDAEVALLAEHGGRVSYNAAANLWFADDILDLPRLMQAGIKVGVGTDAGCGNNSLNVSSDLRVASLAQKCRSHDPAVLRNDELIDMATAQGGEVLNVPVGRLAPGQKADFLVLDTTDYSLLPARSLASSFLHSMSSRAVKHVFCGGRQVVEHGHVTGIDEGELRDRLTRLIPE